jgi:hypothetical protein
VHLGRDDGDPAAARAMLKSGFSAFPAYDSLASARERCCGGRRLCRFRQRVLLSHQTCRGARDRFRCLAKRARSACRWSRSAASRCRNAPQLARRRRRLRGGDLGPVRGAGRRRARARLR